MLHEDIPPGSKKTPEKSTATELRLLKQKEKK
jgi:hypothetical protein